MQKKQDRKGRQASAGSGKNRKPAEGTDVKPETGLREGEFGHSLQGMFEGAGWSAALRGRDTFPEAGNDDWDPGYDLVAEALEAEGFALLADGKPVPGAYLAPQENPDPKASFGYVGQCVRLQSEGPAPRGVLVMRIPGDELGGVSPATLRLFLWEEEQGEFIPLKLSGVDPGRRYVWGRIQQAGLYGMIGIHTDPRILQTILTLKENELLLAGLPEPQRREFIDKVCGLILCAPPFAQAAGALQPWHRSLGFVPEWPEGGPLPEPGNLCERCLGLSLHGGRIPEGWLLPRPWSEGGVVIVPGDCDPKPRWLSIGPANMAGCMMDVCVDPNDSHVVFAAARHGGLWRLRWNQNYSSYTWEALTDNHDTLAMHAVVVAPSRSQTVYAANESGRILQSWDGGANWTIVHAGGARVWRLLVHPQNDSRLFAATSAGLLDIDIAAKTATTLQSGEVTDIAMDPSDPRILFAAIRNVGVRRRDPAAGAWNTIFSLADAQALSVGMFANLLIRIAVGGQGTPATRRLVVKFGPRGMDANGTPTTPAFSEVFRSASGGIGGWQRCTTPPALGINVSGDWVNTVGVAPHDDRVFLVGGERLVQSVDGGQVWAYVMRYYYETGNDRNHEDQHGLAWDRNRQGVVYVANDGGIYMSPDSGATWQGLNRNLVTTEPFHFGVSRDPGTGIKRAVANVDHWGELGTRDLQLQQWEQIEGGQWEFTPARADPKRPDLWYFLRGGEIRRRQFPSTLASPSWAYFPFAHSWGFAIDPRPGSDLGLAAEFNPATGLSQIRRTNQASNNTPAWAVHALAPGMNLTWDQVMALHFIPSTPNAAYAMTSQGRLLYCSNVAAGSAWTERGAWQGGLRWLAVDHFDPNLVMAITPNAIGRSRDGGVTWQNVSLPGFSPSPGEFMRIAPSSAYSGDFFLCTSIGVFYTPDEGEHWRGMHDGLPNTAAWDFYWLDGMLYLAMYGRGLWRCDPYA